MLRTAIATAIFLSFVSIVLADYDTGVAALRSGDYETAFNEFMPLAEAGNAEAQNKIAMMFQRGLGIPQDPDAALKWYQKAADDGFSTAQLNLGAMYQKGVCIPPDTSEAAKWYRKAAEQGVSEAQYSLGVMYFYGNGVPRDIVQAYAWVDVAAASGHERAGDTLGVITSELGTSGMDEARMLAGEFREKYGRGDTGNPGSEPASGATE